jgi:hypothetical protein
MSDVSTLNRARYFDAGIEPVDSLAKIIRCALKNALPIKQGALSGLARRQDNQPGAFEMKPCHLQAGQEIIFGTRLGMVRTGQRDQGLEQAYTQARASLPFLRGERWRAC